MSYWIQFIHQCMNEVMSLGLGVEDSKTYSGMHVLNDRKECISFSDQTCIVLHGIEKASS